MNTSVSVNGHSSYITCLQYKIVIVKEIGQIFGSIKFCGQVLHVFM